jgi:hypothetical protein
VRTWHRALLGVLLVSAIAVAGIALNFLLLRLTQDAHDPVGKLSPRSVFMGTTSSSTETDVTTTQPTPPTSGDAEDDRDRDRDD